MPVIEDLKEYAERTIGLRRPGKRAVVNFVWQRKPHGVRFKNDGLVPNHPRWPLILYGMDPALAARWNLERQLR